MNFDFVNIIEKYKINKDKADIDIINACNTLIRKYGDWLIIESKHSFNIYYSTDRYVVKNGEDKIFSLNVEYDECGLNFAGYDLHFTMNYDIHLEVRRKNRQKLKTLQKLLNQKAEKQKKMFALRNEYVQKLNNSVQFIKQNVK